MQRRSLLAERASRAGELTPARSRWTTLRRFARQSPIGMVSAIVLLAALAVALIGPFTNVGDPQAIDPMAMFASPSAEYPMGGDDLGRSVFARLVFALRISFALATISALLAAVLGTLLGLIAGYAGGLLDEIFMRVTDMLFAFPTLLLAILIAAVMGPGISGVVITIVVATIPVFSRVARGPTLSVRATEYAIASRVIGASPARTLFRHVLPNVMTPLLVQLAFTLSSALIAEGALSFLGLGVQPPTPSLGSLLSNGKTYMEIAPWTMLFPGVTLAAAIFAINLLGDELQRFTDPRQRGR
jgi:ABC-type dipeptide/oligopeptide/nickel transport system permease subunit